MTTRIADTAVQRRIVGVLVGGQVLAGLGQGATAAIGAVIAAEIAGPALSGAAATSSTLGAALTAIPLARLAQRLGRRPALATGAAVAAGGSILTVIATGLTFFPLLVAGFVMLGAGTAVGLQARFAATDAASPDRRGRDLSLVVWSTTIGAVAGPNLFGPGEAIQAVFGVPEHTGSFVIAIVAQLGAVALYLIALRPDPLVLARGGMPAAPTASASNPAATSAAALEASALDVSKRRGIVFAVGAIALSHAVMVSIMAMTPVHLTEHGVSIVIVGFTISLHVAGMFALSPLFGWASDHLGRVPIILFGQALLAVAVVVAGLMQHSTVAVTVALVFLGLGWSASTVSGSALIADLATGSNRVRIQGRTDTIMSLSGAVGGALSGPALAAVAYSGLAWLAGLLIVVVVTSAVFVRLPPRADSITA